jgi:hypothetical protein
MTIKPIFERLLSAEAVRLDNANKCAVPFLTHPQHASAWANPPSLFPTPRPCHHNPFSRVYFRFYTPLQAQQSHRYLYQERWQRNLWRKPKSRRQQLQRGSRHWQACPSPFFPFLSYSPNPSADLWVAGSVPNTKDTGKSVSVAYAVGNVKGADVPIWRQQS